MDRGAWWATVQGIARVGHNTVNKHEHELPPKQRNKEMNTEDVFSVITWFHFGWREG